MNNEINVTSPFLPPLQEYQKSIESIWERGWLTNHGPLVNELETRLTQYLNLHNLMYVSNGTIALQIAIKALDLKGEVITTPFSYVATTSSIVWEGCEPVMVDICPATFNIDAEKIESAITSRTSAILATHVYGNPCDVEKIQAIANKFGLKVIYDAAHAFGTKYKNSSIISYGDVSTLSFHATKLFHTIEGGGLSANSPEVMQQIGLMRNFGHVSPTDFACVGINGKNSEFHAAMGLCVLNYIEDILKTRRELSEYYDEQLAGLPIVRPSVLPETQYNYAYYPVVFESEKVLHEVTSFLQGNKIFPRRYFYPSLSNLEYVKGNYSTVICNDISKRVLCLPLYHTLSREEIERVCDLIRRVVI